MDWTEIKNSIEAATGLSRDALHIYSALLIQIGASALFRRRLSHWLPWLVVLVAVGVNEYLDAYDDGRLEQWEFGTALHDLWNTMLVPTTLFVLTRFAPGLAVNPSAAPPASPRAGEPRQAETGARDTSRTQLPRAEH